MRNIEAQAAIDHLRDVLDALPRDITPEQFAAFLRETSTYYTEYLTIWDFS